MKVIVGLGNPGLEYERTRHNAGFMAVDRLASRHARGAVARSRFQSAVLESEIAGEKCLLMKPTTYMNRSGGAVAEAVRFYKVDPRTDLIVLVDETALPSGMIRVRGEGSAGGHNGLADIERALGSAAYPRLRIGIDAPPPRMVLADYVLGRLTEEQRARLEPALDKAADAVELFVQKGVTAAMNRFNEKNTPPPAGGEAGGGVAPGARGDPRV